MKKIIPMLLLAAFSLAAIAPANAQPGKKHYKKHRKVVVRHHKPMPVKHHEDVHPKPMPHHEDKKP